MDTSSKMAQSELVSFQLSENTRTAKARKNSLIIRPVSK